MIPGGVRELPRALGGGGYHSAPIDNGQQLDGPQDMPMHLIPGALSGALPGDVSPIPSPGRQTDILPTSPPSSPITSLPGQRGAAIDPTSVTPTTDTVAPPATPGTTDNTNTTNAGGAGLAGNGPLIDALTSAFGGGGYQSPLDASSSPSTAALEALQPTSGATSTSGNPTLEILIVLGAIAIGAWLYFKHKKPAEKKP